MQNFSQKSSSDLRLEIAEIILRQIFAFISIIASKKTSLTYGPDVARAIADLVGNEKSYGQAFHITTDESHTWGEILDFYCEKIEEITGKKVKVKLIENSNGLMTVWNKWQIKYDRLYAAGIVRTCPQ